MSLVIALLLFATETVVYVPRLSVVVLIRMLERHGWLHYMVDAPPTQDKILQTGLRPWEMPEHRANMTLTRGAFKTYST